MSDSIHVVIVDDHPLFREGVIHTLKTATGIVVVGEGATADEAIRLAGELLPELLLLDIAIPGGGIAVAQAIAVAYPVVKIVMLTASEDEENMVAALKAGARAYILKGVPARELIHILRMVERGEGYVPPSMAASILIEMSRAAPEGEPSVNPLDALTDREHQILEQVAAGYSNKEIGYQLHLSEKTVKYYMTNILQKLHVRNRVEAALLAREKVGKL